MRSIKEVEHMNIFVNYQNSSKIWWIQLKEKTIEKNSYIEENWHF